MSYLESKSGSIQETVKEMQKHLKDNAYQQMFKKELEKTGKGIGAMSDQEKKDFFNKLDKKYKGEKESVNEAEMPSGPDRDQMNAKKATNKDPKKGEKTVVDPAPKMEEESFDIEKLKEDVNTLWSNAAKDLEEMKKNAKYMKAQDVAPDSDTESEKEKKGKTLVGSAKSKIETEPKVDYQK